MNDARPMLPTAAGEPFGLGARAMRREDLPLVTGVGQFVADTVLPGEVHAVFVRSVHPHARIVAIDATQARAMPGVLAVLTGRPRPTRSASRVWAKRARPPLRRR